MTETKKQQTDAVKGLTTDEVQKMIKKIQDDLQEYDNRAKEVCQRHNMTHEELKKYVENPNNFSAEEWKILQKVKSEVDEFKQKMWKALGRDASEIEKIVEQKKQKKHRFVGMKKKQWIPMP